MGPRMGPTGEGPQMPEDSKVTADTDATPGGKASVAKQPSMLHSIKFFVLCHSLLQLAQLMISGYLKSSISTVEKRYGLSSQTSGLLAAFNEVGNVGLIVFVSYFGSRVHRPRLIGCGALLVALAGLLMSLPQFISEPYRYDHTSPDLPQASETSLCLPVTSDPAPAHSNGNCSSYTETRHLAVVGLMFVAQTLLGVGAVPIQPFGISYIDDFAHSNNSPLYLGILFAVTMLGPGLAYGLGGLMLRLYVDINRMPEGGISLTSKDPRWVGAWWLGFLISAGAVALAATPYFFFPREMPKEKHELRFRSRILSIIASPASKVSSARHTLGSSSHLLASFCNPNFIPPGHGTSCSPRPSMPGINCIILTVLQVFPRVLLRNLRHPIFLLVVLAQVCLLSTVAGMATFLPKFLERQFSITASYANVLIGGLTIPAAIIGVVVGGVLVKRLHLGPMRSATLCLLGALLGLLCSLPLFFMGCSTHQIAGVTPGPGTRAERELFPGCAEPCSSPLCFYVALGAWSPLMLTLCVFSLARGVKREDKTLAVGIQFMLQRVLAWMLSPVVHGSTIDTTCVYWAQSCGRRAVCRYYDHDLLRTRFIGLQFFFKVSSLACFTLVLVVLRQQRPEAGAKLSLPKPGREQQLLESGPEKKPEDPKV
ncbi:solute carrier organic anion transporter family member 2B1 [Echinops telfairi]|uniref:Solute carrier organic anion transporter family member 2B1 n=1 Tax=Echinops telfairi TaxID=9371 RepID=A0AC55DBA1_ECHTE|nr:solute carrier organic anion transporter family member 2B1 [Echinops telfairi]